jgi:cation diffusion facilitator family transporter
MGLYRDRLPADVEHPLGHGRERFLWSFMAAIASFLIGGCLSVAMAVAQLKGHHTVPGGPLAWIVLAISFLADGTSWLQSLRQARRQAKDYKLTTWRYILRSSDPVVRAVFFEDSAALIGLVVAASGLLLSRIFGTSVPDSLASLVIGLLLASTAIVVARPFADFLVGRSIASPILEEILAMVESDAAIEQVLTFRAIYSGPEEVLVMAKIYPTAHIDSEQFSQAMDTLDLTIRLAFPFVADVFIDVTATHVKGES